MSNIEIGEYVRTPEQGFIGKLIEINKDVLNYYKIDVGREVQHSNWGTDNYIYSRDGLGLKHSKNIIDLIEVGDYVNGKKIDAILDGGWEIKDFAERVLCFETDFPIEKGLRTYRNCDIKSIVTKEQFKEMEYRVDE